MIPIIIPTVLPLSDIIVQLPVNPVGKALSVNKTRNAQNNRKGTGIDKYDIFIATNYVKG